MPHPIANEPGWTILADRTPVTYTRPLLGAEFTHDLGHRLSDGLGDVCMGVTFKSSLSEEELERRCYEAMGRLRFIAPVLACNIVSDPEDPFLRSWIYESPTSTEDVHRWIRQTFSVRKGHFTTDDFILEMNRTRTPYTHADGHSQIAHFYLLLGPDGTHALFMHGPHTIMDARPTLRGLDYILEMIANPPVDRLEDLDWAEEWTRLPVGPVTATGGPRDDWDTKGVELLQESTRVRMNPVRTHTLRPSRDTVQTIGNMHRAIELIDPETSSQIVKAVKSHGFSMSYLADAALALSVFEGNPIPLEQNTDAHFTMDPCVISHDKYLVPPHNGLSHFVAGLSLIPLRVYYKNIHSEAPMKAKLLKSMEIVKKQYDYYISNPNLPHLLPVQLALYPPRRPRAFDPYSSLMTNLGSVESFVKSKRDEGDKDVIQVLDMAFGHRLGWQRLMNHIWSMNSMLHLQVQASDVWDMSFLREHLKRMKSIILSLLDDESPCIGSPTAATVSNSGVEPDTEHSGRNRTINTGSSDDAQNFDSDESTVANSPTSTTNTSNDLNPEPSQSKVTASKDEPPRSKITSTNEIPYPGFHFTRTTHHDTYPAINPSNADLRGKVIFVSGASRGIGRAIAISFAKAGASGIAIAARTRDDLEKLKNEINADKVDKPIKVLAVYLDLLDDSSIQSAAEQIRETFGRLDVVINNAGTIDRPLPLSSIDMDDWWLPFTTNLRGTLAVTRHLLPLLKETECGAKTVINIVSSNALTSSPYCSGYGLSKLSLLQMTEILQKEHQVDGVTVFAVHPGSVATSMTDIIPEGRRHILIDPPELCADTLVWLVKERREWLGGRYISSVWDMEELEGMKEMILKEDRLKVTLSA